MNQDFLLTRSFWVLFYAIRRCNYIHVYIVVVSNLIKFWYVIYFDIFIFLLTYLLTCSWYMADLLWLKHFMI